MRPRVHPNIIQYGTDTQLAQDALQIASGMATSAACAAANLGADAVLLGRIGDDELGRTRGP